MLVSSNQIFFGILNTLTSKRTCILVLLDRFFSSHINAETSNKNNGVQTAKGLGQNLVQAPQHNARGVDTEY